MSTRVIIALFFGWACNQGAYALDNDSVERALGISPEWACVVEAWSPSDRPASTPILLIQDRHGHDQAQDHVARLLLELAPEWRERTVFMEGAFGPVSPANDSSDALPAPERADQWLRASHQSEFRLLGMEDASLYFKNVEAFARVDAVREVAQREWRTSHVVSTFLDLPHPAPDLMERLLTLRLTPDQYAVYLKSSRPKITNVTLAEAVQAAETYYLVANARSDHFADRLLAEPAPSIVLVGGFHTRRMAERLRQAGRAYVILVPTVSHGGYQVIYEDRMRQTARTILGPKAPARLVDFHL